MTSDGWRRMESHPKFVPFASEYLSALCLTDFWYFLKYCAYYRGIQHYYEPLHGPYGLSGFLQDWSMDDGAGGKTPCTLKMLAISRGHCKTQQASIAYSAWRLARNPGERHMIRSHKDASACDILAGVKNILLSDTFARMFPWCRPALTGSRKTCWSRSAILLHRVQNLRTNSVHAFGFNSDATGDHFDYGVYDDWETDESAHSEELRAQLFERFDLDENLMEGGPRLGIGTPYHREGWIQSAIERKNGFQNKRYGLFVRRDVYKAFDECFAGDECELLDDRETFVCRGAGFPTELFDLKTCQAAVSFFSPVVRDTVTELREVVWNDGEHFRVNRPIPRPLGQPVSWKIGNEKPTAPNRCTLDSVNEHPEETDGIIRRSLPELRKTMGTRIYSAQMQLNPIDSASLVFNPENIVEVDEADVPRDDISNYRAWDLASSKKTKASTAAVTAVHHHSGVYIVNIYYGNRWSSPDILLELFLGKLREESLDRPIQCDFFENARIEETIGDFIRKAELAPYDFFVAMGGKFRIAAEKFLKEYRSGLFVHRREIKRPGYQSKTMRIQTIQPVVDSGKLHIVKGIDNSDVFWRQVETFSLDSNDSFDVLDCVRDVVVEGSARAVNMDEKKNLVSEFHQHIRHARSGYRRASFGRLVGKGL